MDKEKMLENILNAMLEWKAFRYWFYELEEKEQEEFKDDILRSLNN